MTLRVVAEHADVWNVIGSVEDVVRKASVLDQHCADVGRDPATVKRSVQPRLDPANPTAMIDLLHAYIDAGFSDNIIYVPPGSEPVRAAEIAAERILSDIVRQLS